jgi:hypothetical protein
MYKYLMLINMFAILSCSSVLAQDFSGDAQNISDSFKKLSEEQKAELDKLEMNVLDNEDLENIEMYKIMSGSQPAIGEVHQVYMGDKMVEQKTGKYADCITPMFSSEEKTWGTRFLLKEGTPACRLDADAKAYTPPYLNVYSGNGDGFSYPLKLSERKGLYELCFDSGMGCVGDIEDIDKVKVKIGVGFVAVENGFQQTIEYAGRSGDQAKFLYSEFKDGLSRPSFNREFEVDLSGGSVAAYKGAVFEIIEATNATISYKMVRHFQ